MVVYSSDGFRFRDLQVMSPMSQPQTNTPPPARNHLIRSFSRSSLFSFVITANLFFKSSIDLFVSGSFSVCSFGRELVILDWMGILFSNENFASDCEA